MKITNINSHKIIEYTPIQNGHTKIEQTVYELSNGKRLTVDTVKLNNIKQAQDKTLSQNGKELKEIVVEFVNGIRDKVIRVL